MRLIAIAIALGVALLSVAAPVSRAQSIDADARAAAREMMAAMNVGELIDQILVAIKPQMVDMLTRMNPAQRGAVERAYDEIILPSLRDERALMIVAFEDLYIRYYSAAEMRDLTAFYQTPTGRKSLRVLPQLQADSMAAGSAWAQNAVRRTLERNAEELRRRGINL
ncbi:MAG: hypothetical protein C6Y20_14065 [Tagaea sp. CACIAM 22H2]|nr:hypothetical protein [Tagaea sp. CACIAM 22H2]